MTKLLRHAFFLDRDGVINRPILRSGKPFAPTLLDDIEILPGVYEALSRLREAGFLNIIVTNQPDISTGVQSLESLSEIHHFMKHKLPIDDVFFCPHVDDDMCECRKPQPGLLVRAAQKWNVDLASSFMVGDRWRDIEAGQRAGCQSNFFIDYRYSERSPQGVYIKAPSLLKVVKYVLNLK